MVNVTIGDIYTRFGDVDFSHSSLLRTNIGHIQAFSSEFDYQGPRTIKFDGARMRQSSFSHINGADVSFRNVIITKTRFMDLCIGNQRIMDDCSIEHSQMGYLFGNDYSEIVWRRTTMSNSIIEGLSSDMKGESSVFDNVNISRIVLQRSSEFKSSFLFENCYIRSLLDWDLYYDDTVHWTMIDSHLCEWVGLVGGRYINVSIDIFGLSHSYFGWERMLKGPNGEFPGGEFFNCTILLIQDIEDRGYNRFGGFRLNGTTVGNFSYYRIENIEIVDSSVMNMMLSITGSKIIGSSIEEFRGTVNDVEIVDSSIGNLASKSLTDLKNFNSYIRTVGPDLKVFGQPDGRPQIHHPQLLNSIILEFALIGAVDFRESIIESSVISLVSRNLSKLSFANTLVNESDIRIVSSNSLNHPLLEFDGCNMQNSSFLAKAEERPWADFSWTNAFIKSSRVRVMGIRGGASLDLGTFIHTELKLTKVRDVPLVHTTIRKNSLIQVQDSQDGRIHKVNLTGSIVRRSEIVIGNRWRVTR
uniref:Uncharacterized protein n=1 Tax=Compsopogon caeruleus TaxID=31354 RepID=A0A7S1TDH1_9RHOD|mmetsp:Transcript_1864/g.3382  ORF Transcript_1864/g.3382 Transcript_1864/m.3382 type:complete len:528 (+) Transcript_1864:759-2342(+)|eukprot:CAMPEP_0184685596 /NCGR_PEP_ID=MMETSP0312-20130426/19485_1 /TAXON_ID=31354 /ORGANISM="Compsopogon coeruleus, Strain SAG 36.94" /LENGTH=527 /DNA_ID=CAMNT_0027139817 /DNA_START=729 /DNA_END=2312 /DNA_ORIENTATION=+